MCFVPLVYMHEKLNSIWSNELLAYCETTTPECLFNFPSTVSNKFAAEMVISASIKIAHLI